MGIHSQRERHVSTTQSRTDGRDEETRTPRSGVTVLRDRLDEETRNPDDLDLIHDVLSNRRRRQILHILEADPDKSGTVPDLASTIAAWEMDIDHPDTVSYDERKSVQSTIYQHHAPKMADAGLVEFDKRAGRLELDGPAVRLEPTRDDADEDSATGGWTWLPAHAAIAGCTAALAVSVAATAVISGLTTAFAVFATSVVTAVVIRHRSDPPPGDG